MTARKTFEHELEQLNVELIHMGALIENAIENSITAFKEQNLALAREIMKRDEEINEAEKNVEAKCLSLILRQQPVARDLRVVSTAMKLVTDMERIGDQASDIAEIVLHMKGSHIFTIVEHIPAMAKTARRMVHDAVEAFVQNDLEQARAVMKEDDQMDALFDKVKLDVVRLMKESDVYPDRYVDFLMIAKYLERIGDHAVNICEWVEFNRTGEYKHYRMI